MQNGNNFKFIGKFSCVCFWGGHYVFSNATKYTTFPATRSQLVHKLLFLGSKFGTGYLKYLKKKRPKKACKRSLIGTLLDVLQTEDSNIDVDTVIVKMKSK